jgi:hypothetical protein
MAKVEGSNPFIRFDQNPRKRGGFVLLRHTGDEHYPVVGGPVGSKRGCGGEGLLAMPAHAGSPPAVSDSH